MVFTPFASIDNAQILDEAKSVAMFEIRFEGAFVDIAIGEDKGALPMLESFRYLTLE